MQLPNGSSSCKTHRQDTSQNSLLKTVVLARIVEYKLEIVESFEGFNPNAESCLMSVLTPPEVLRICTNVGFRFKLMIPNSDYNKKHTGLQQEEGATFLV